MANVTEDVLRAIAQNRAWVKNYGVAHGLTRNPKTPVAMSLTLMQRLVERDVRRSPSIATCPSRCAWRRARSSWPTSALSAARRRRGCRRRGARPARGLTPHSDRICARPSM